MGVFADWAAVRGQPLAESYVPSARVVEGVCGEGFVTVNVTVAGKGGGVRGKGVSWWVLGVAVGVSVGGVDLVGRGVYFCLFVWCL